VRPRPGCWTGATLCHVTDYGVLPPDLGWQVRGMGDLDGDGRADVFGYNSLTGATGAWLLNGVGVAAAVSYGWVAPDSGWQVRGVGDLDGDGRADVFGYNTSTGQTGAWLLDGAGVVAAVGYGVVAPDSGWQVRGMGDLDGDGRADVFWHNILNGATTAWFLDGGAIRETVAYPSMPSGG
jgi:FG-GAP-like repeat